MLGHALAVSPARHRRVGSAIHGLTRGQQTSPIKDLRVIIFSFAGQVSVTTTQLCPGILKTAIDNAEMNGRG